MGMAVDMTMNRQWLALLATTALRCGTIAELDSHAPAFSLAMPARRARRVNVFEAQGRARGLEP